MNSLALLICSLLPSVLAAVLLLRARMTTRRVVLACGAGIAVTAAVLAIGAAGALTGSANGATAPSIQSDLPDYNPGQAVTLTGAGWEPGAGPVRIVVRDASGTVWTHTADVTPDARGVVTDTFTLPQTYVPEYTVSATQSTESGTLRASWTFTDANPSANLDQCANGTVPADTVNGCSTVVADWVNGNLGSSKALYYEGDSIPYRMRFGNLSLAPATHTVTIEWDTTKGGKNAIDYLTSFNRTVLNANPCLGVTACPAYHNDFAIPADPQVTGAGVTPVAGDFVMHGGMVTGVSGYSGGAGFPAGDNARRITITFTADVANPVLVWGGHISTRRDWGANSSAVNIPGSPYHMRLVELDGSGGNQDRSLSAAAVVYPASITIVKSATPSGPTSFPFTASPAPLTDFNLVDDGTSANTRAFTGIVDFKTYSVAESVPAGWALTGVDCSVSGGTSTTPPSTATNTVSIALQEGDNVVCTYANAAKAAPQLHLRKVVVNDNGGTATVADFTLTADGAGTNDLTGTSPVDSGAGLKPDTWTLSETSVAGYAASSWDCVGGTQDGSMITVDYGESATCTITNDDIAPKLHLRKLITNDNGGTATVADFTLTANGTGTNDLSGTSPVDSGASLKADTWVLSETTVAGYSASAWDCNGGTQDGTSITVGIGGEATCTITNNDIAPKLHLRKLITNDNGGTATLVDFTLTANGTGTNDLSGTSPVDSGASLKADTWVLSETTVSGYAASAWDCTGGTQDGTSITVGIGGEATCTITNDDIAPKLHLRKVITNDNGGTAVLSDFTLTANGTGSNDLSGTSPVDSGATLKADTWVLSETTVAGYAASAWDCTGGTQDGTSITLPIGGEATCTITNNDIAPKLHLRKLVTNDNGGTATVADFTLTANGTGTNDLSGTSPVDSGASLKADTWVLSETTVAGYAASAWDCVGGTQDGTSITVGIGGEATCTITNNDIAPKLHLRKVVTNDNGGTATVADFTLTANGTGTNDLTGTSPVDSGATLKADTWTLSETTVAGYSASAWDCVGGTQDGTSITVGIGGEATCTITNDDIAPKLHLRKVITNDNGGTAVLSDFTLTANGTGTNDLSGTSPVDSGSGLKADTWTLSETTVAGYSASAWDCTGGTQDGTSITVGIGGEATCTITNNDIAPKLHLRKLITNDNGGTAVLSDFTLTANGTGTNDITGTSPVDSGASLKADTWVLSETTVAGYSASAWDCVGGTQDGTSITVGIGGEATCTITNNDIAPKLHLRKVITNDNGGTATLADFTLTANGTGTNDLSGTSPVDSGASLKADTWVLSETTVAGYAASAWDCIGGTQDGTSITVGIGGEATCTITNNDIAPKLHLRKLITNDNGGTAVLSDFTLTANGTGTNDLSGTSPVDSGAGLKADTWVLSETTVAGYSASAWDCVGGTQDDTQDGTSITVGIGGEATCTITNNDIAPKLHLRKLVVNDNGGTATLADFTLTASGTEANDLTGTSPVDSGDDLSADTWTLSETGPAGYSASAWDCVGGTQDGTSITVGIGGEATCTITNDDIAPVLHLRKLVVNDNGGTATVSDFTLTADGTGTNDLSGTSPVDSGATLSADTWTLSETSLIGYTASAWTCVGGTQSGSAITVPIGGEATCTITNNDAPVILPPVRVRGYAVISGPTGCILGQTVTAKVTGRYIARVVFLRDGRIVKRIKGRGTGRQVFRYQMVLRPSQVGVHTITARVFFVADATPRLRVLKRRFALCPRIAVTG